MVNGKTEVKSFSDEYTAKLWGTYKETIMNEMDAFGFSTTKALTPKDLLISKFGEDGEYCIGALLYLEPISNTSINDLGYDEYMNFAKHLLDTPVQIKHNSKVKKKPAIKTVLSKFSYLSSAINHAREKGLNIENHPHKIVQWLRSLHKKKE